MKRSVFRVVLLQLVSPHLRFLWQAFTTGSVTKATPIQFTDGKSGIKKRRGCKTALSGYYACLSRDLLLTASGVDTHTHTHTHIHQHSLTKQFQEMKAARAWFKKFYGKQVLLMYNIVIENLILCFEK